MYLLGFLFLAIPFSIAIDFGDHQLEVPSEPLLLILTIVGLFYFYRIEAWQLSLVKHPLFLVSLAFIVWNLMTTITANHFYISAKYTSISLLQWWVFFCLFAVFYKESKGSNITWVLYGLSFVLVLFYAWWQHFQYDFRMDASVLVARPFYFDHALYSCTALLLLGFTFPYWRLKKKRPSSWMVKICSILLLSAIYLSFSRAAWLSMMAGLVVTSVVVYFRFSFRQFLSLSALLILFLIMGFVLLVPQKESQVLSKQGGSWQHLQSTINISNDVSNLERLNRYSCAWRMFKNKPLLGYGPGNFIIDYYPFQQAHQMTRLSVKSHQRHRPGKGGGAHSGYFQVLSEMGLIGFLLWFSLILISLRSCFNIWKNPHSGFDKNMAIGIFFSLLTFFIHSLFNNFFHDEKTTALVWSSMAILVVMDKKIGARK